MIQSMVVGFSSMGFDATLSGGCGIWEHLHSFRKVKCLQGYTKTLPMAIWKLKTPPVVVEHSVVVMPAGSQSRRSQIESNG